MGLYRRNYNKSVGGGGSSSNYDQPQKQVHDAANNQHSNHT